MSPLLYLYALIIISCFTNYIPNSLILFIIPSLSFLFLTSNLLVPIFVPIPNSVSLDPKSYFPTTLDYIFHLLLLCS